MPTLQVVSRCSLALLVAVSAAGFVVLSGCRPYVEKVPLSVCMFNLRQMRGGLLEVAKALGPEGLRRLDFSPEGSGWRRFGVIPSSDRPCECPSAKPDEGYGYVLNPRLFYHPISEIADQDWLIADSAPRHDGYYWAITRSGKVFKTRLLL
ncbi:MAG: hypothetical protein AMXMBFR61_04210 [Fimbriimonadales bacterium]